MTINASIAYADADGTSDSLAAVNFFVTLASKLFSHFKQSVGITEQVIPLGGITSVGYIIAINLDPTNTVSLKTGTGGVICATLKPGGGPALIPLGSGMQAPFAIASTAPCLVEFFLCSN